MRLVFVGLFLFITLHARAAVLDLSALSPEARSRSEKLFQRAGEGEFSAAELDNLVRNLILEQQYDSAEITKHEDNGKLVYRARVGRVRKIGSLRFTGTDAISETEVRREFGIVESSQFIESTLLDATERVRQYYEAQGYAQARVDLEVHSQKDGGVQVDVRVTEGPQTTINEFEIVAENPDFREKLTRNLRGFRKDPINEKTMSALRTRIREFLSANKFYRSEIQDPQIVKGDQPSRSNLIYRFANSDQYALEFHGNLLESDREITSSLGLEQFTSSNPNVGAELGTKVKNFYVGRGYARAEVKVEERMSTNNRFVRVLQFDIKEGPRVRVKNIEWIGRFSETAKFYTQFLKAHSSEMVDNGFYVKEDLDVGLKNLIVDRRNQGFLKAKVVSTRTSTSPQKNEVTLQINFDEGPLTQIRSIKFIGNQQVIESDLLRQLFFEQGEPLKLNRLEDSILKLRRYYQGQGFLEMNLLNEKQDLVRYNEDNTLVDVVFQIYEGPRVSVGSIVIEGNTITKDYVIYKELEFKVGDILTPDKIDESTSRLQRVGHFSAVEIKTLEEKTATAVRTVLIRVTDRNPGLFLLGTGISNERGVTLRGYTGLSYRNINGMGRGLSARADVNYNVTEVKYPERKFTVGYLEPYLFDTRTRGRISLTQAFAIKPTDTNLGTELRQLTWTVEQDITSHVLLSWDVSNLAKFRDFQVPSENEITNLSIGSTAMTFDIDFRDHPFIPTRGTFTRLNFEYGSPGLGSNDTIEYERMFGSFTHYQSLGLFGIVWANSVRGGYIRNLSPNGAVPYDKRGFLLGGETTIRGFQPGEAFPNSNDFKNLPVTAYDPAQDRYNLKTEATMYLVKSEVRFPLTFLYKNVGGAFFYDGGAVKISGLLADQPYRDSYGIAARYITPVGALSIEYGWKVFRPNDRVEDPGVFNISFGTF